MAVLDGLLFPSSSPCASQQGRMATCRPTSFLLTCLLVLVLQFVSHSAGQDYTIIPQNVTASSGKTATFRCGVSKLNLGEKLNFTVIRPEANYTLSCPGPANKPATLSLSGQCDPTDIVATWNVTVGANLNGTIFRCQVNGLSDKYGYLWVDASSSYYAMLFGCVMGGFFGILIVFGVSYVALKRSERLQECFKGKGEEEESTIVESSKVYN